MAKVSLGTFDTTPNYYLGGTGHQVRYWELNWKKEQCDDTSDRKLHKIYWSLTARNTGKLERNSYHLDWAKISLSIDKTTCYIHSVNTIDNGWVNLSSVSSDNTYKRDYSNIAVNNITQNSTEATLYEMKRVTDDDTHWVGKDKVAFNGVFYLYGDSPKFTLTAKLQTFTDTNEKFVDQEL
jgi:hypothetical protein